MDVAEKIWRTYLHLIDGMIFLKILAKGGELVMYYINRECLNMRDFDELSNYWGE